MNASDVQKLFEYNQWANERMLEVISTLGAEAFGQPIVSSFSSIRDTLAHIAGSQWIWLQRWRGDSPQQQPSWMDAPPFALVAGELRTIDSDCLHQVRALHDEALSTTLHYRNIKGDPFAVPLGDTLVHCVNHSTYHRGQLTTMLRQVGSAPPSTDYVLYVRTATARG